MTTMVNLPVPNMKIPSIECLPCPRTRLSFAGTTVTFCYLEFDVNVAIIVDGFVGSKLAAWLP